MSISSSPKQFHNHLKNLQILSCLLCTNADDWTPLKVQLPGEYTTTMIGTMGRLISPFSKRKYEFTENAKPPQALGQMLVTIQTGSVILLLVCFFIQHLISNNKMSDLSQHIFLQGMYKYAATFSII